MTRPTNFKGDDEIEKKTKYKVGQTAYLKSHQGKIEEIVLWDDGIVRYKIQGYGGLVHEEDIFAC